MNCFMPWVHDFSALLLLLLLLLLPVASAWLSCFTPPVSTWLRVRHHDSVAVSCCAKEIAYSRLFNGHRHACFRCPHVVMVGSGPIW